MASELRETVEVIPYFEDSPEKFKDSLDTSYIIEDEFDDLKKKLYSCELCNIQVTSANVLRRHKEGRKHQMRVERQGKTFACELCEITANSQSQLDAHLRSSKHKARLMRKENPIRLNKGFFLIFFCVLCILANLAMLFRFIF